ncbi:hypothetical protein GCM10023185_24170 [Hymenobacter saemangeumensis]|uniref:OmpA-like domain-containing protein n=1 Tax=Hymenobacter saemangeumensis TaxID=1084522 RepID=A0ABP8IH77_9BACT
MGSIPPQRIRLDQTRILFESGNGDYSWCQGFVEFTYDASEERLTGYSTFRPVNNCSNSSFDLFRVKLKSPAKVTAGQASTLRVSGRQVQWYADPELRQPVAEGNSYRTRLSKTTTFYLTQGFYPTRHSEPVAITVEAVPLEKAPRLAPKPGPAPAKATAPSPAAMVLPTVLFRSTTAELLPESAPALQHLAAELKARPRLRLRIAGHTDRIGEAGKNKVLSEQRAGAVKAFLVNAGIAPERIETTGYGHTRLLYPSPDIRNRRVEIEELK